MIVVDASAMLEVLLNSPAAAAVRGRLFAPGETMHAPHLIDLEIAQVLRRYSMTRVLSAQRIREALEDYTACHDPVLRSTVPDPRTRGDPPLRRGTP